jgi:PAP_fibrillin
MVPCPRTSTCGALVATLGLLNAFAGADPVLAFETLIPPRTHRITRTWSHCCRRRDKRIFQRNRLLTLGLSTNESDGPDETSLKEALKEVLKEIARQSSRGFQATQSQRKRAEEVLEELSRLNPSQDPARDYYPNPGVNGSSPHSSSLCGKWTLIYTDAPDIVGLGAPNVLAELGRIGQHCDPPFIKNVIEWKRPAWSTDLLSSLLPSNVAPALPRRVLQKVITKARASSEEPLRVQLDVAGLQVSFDEETALSSEDGGENNSGTTVQARGLFGSYLSNAILDVQGPLSLPFGEFRVLYLDDAFRAIRTFQGYIAVNVRIQSTGDAWF